MNESLTAGYYTSLLYANPSFLEGMARLLDFGNVLTEYNTAPSGEAADYIALASDFAAIGEDLQAAFVEFARLNPQSFVPPHAS